MLKRQKAIAGLLIAGNVLLVANLIVSGTPPAGAQVTTRPHEPQESPAPWGDDILPVPEPPELPTFVAQPTPRIPMAAVLPEVIRARAFEVVDDQGRVVIRIGLDVNGEAGIVTTDSSGSPLTVFGAYRGGGMISTFSRAGKPLVTIKQDHHGKGKITYGPPEPAGAEQ